MSRPKRAPTAASPGADPPFAAPSPVPPVATVSSPRAPAPATPGRQSSSALPDLALALRARTPVVHLATAEEERALGLLEQTCAALDRRLFAWTQTRGLGPPRGARWDPSLRDPLAVLEHIAESAEPAVYALLDLHPLLAASPAVARKLKDAARALTATGGAARAVVLVGPSRALPPELAHEVTALDLPLPRPDELAAALEGFVARAGVPVRLDPAGRAAALARAARGLSLKQAAAALAGAIVAHGAVDAGALAALRRARRDALGAAGLLEPVEPAGAGLDALGGLDVFKRWVESRGAALGEDARAYGLPAPRGVLLVGPQGTGKGLCARAIAGAWDLPLARLDAGAGEDAARAALALAERAAPCVLWIDAIERRVGGAHGGALLAWLARRDAPVFVVATARDADALPPELARRGRFDEVFLLDLPGPAERVEVLRVHLEQRGRAAGGFDLESLAEASDGFSGAELERAVVEGLFHAFGEGRPLATRDVLRALREAVPLARVAREPLEALRRWAPGRARLASTPPPAVAGAAARRIIV